MKVLITGGSGFIGSTITRDFLDKGHHVVVTGTSPRPENGYHDRYRYIQADTTREGPWQAELEDVDGVINLAGRNLFGRWTKRYKKEIYDSRILTTRNVVDALAVHRGTFLCSTSAVGYYGDRDEDVLTESEPAGQGFLAEVGRDWEDEAMRAEEHGIRTVIMRFGIVLGQGGGALEKMVPAFRMWVGGPLGNGRQWFPWIHLQDLVAACFYVVDDQQSKGAFNFCSPNPVRNRELAKTLGHVLGVPAVVPAPKLMLRLALGKAATALFDSLRVIPANLQRSGFDFRYPDLEDALRQVVS
ncbi:MAG: TIGR01777 family oxidoreductase [Desulfobacterales bacterium]